MSWLCLQREDDAVQQAGDAYNERTMLHSKRVRLYSERVRLCSKRMKLYRTLSIDEDTEYIGDEDGQRAEKV